MRLIRVFLLLPVFLGCPSGPASADETTFAPYGRGVGVASVTVRFASYDSRVTILRIDPDTNAIRVLAMPERTGMTVPAYLQSAGAVAALSGGFLKSRRPVRPTGLVRVEGRTLSTPALGDTLANGVVCASEGAVAIDALRVHNQVAPWRDCLQAGPLLVQDGDPTALAGVPAAFSTQRHDRAFIGLDALGRPYLGVAEQVALPDLARFLAGSREAGGLDLVSALNLTGAATAALAFSDTAGTVHAVGTPTTQLPNALAAVPR